jgi:hypothetical protein
MCKCFENKVAWSIKFPVNKELLFARFYVDSGLIFLCHDFDFNLYIIFDGSRISVFALVFSAPASLTLLLFHLAGHQAHQIVPPIPCDSAQPKPLSPPVGVTLLHNTFPFLVSA